ncbi:hypothetical protein [Actinocrinis sp.]|uniref:hypothetical protein n=1 Tax=Actinocrinis sp. TaxID=1920516 RepID=UPI002D6680F8|nr:hypothetical protein [Actinocrinis sp.]HZP54611.1 hypothetical protein [Actinocrinis sp.]
MGSRQQAHKPAPPIKENVRKGVMIGGTVVLLCAAGISFPTLYALGRLIGLPKPLAVLLPVSIDAYAYIAMWFADRVPAVHPARESALRNGAGALAMSVACNILDRFLVLAGTMVQPWIRDVLLSLVAASPPFIVGRVLHLRALADGNGNAAEETPLPVAPAKTATPPRVASPALPAVAKSPATPPAATPAATALPASAVARPAPSPAAGNSPRRLIPKDEKDKIVARLLADHGDDVALMVIADAIGTKHRATAMKVRDRVIEARDKRPDTPDEPADDPEPAWAVS